MNIRILTHSGVAHLDEVFAIAAIIIAKGYDLSNVDVVRTFDVEEASKGYDYVVDFGGEYDGISRFDHHQGGDDVHGKSSFGLVVESMEELSSLRGNAFVERVDFQDNNGPKATIAKYLGSDASLGQWFDSFELLEQMMLSEFSGGDIKFALTMATKVISNELEKAQAKAEAESNMESAEVINVNGLTVLICDFDVVSNPKYFTIGNAVTGAKAVEVGAELILGKGRDPSQYSLVRTKQGEYLDLSVLEGRVPFAHKGGFFAALSRDEDWKAIVELLA